MADISNVNTSEIKDISDSLEALNREFVKIDYYLQNPNCNSAHHGKGIVLIPRILSIFLLRKEKGFSTYKNLHSTRVSGVSGLLNHVNLFNTGKLYF